MVMTAATDPRLGPAPAPGPRMMVYEVELDDGSIAEIEAPEGTTEPELLEAVRGYKVASVESATGGLVQDPAAKGRASNGFENLLGGLGRGLEDVGTGTAQLALHSAPVGSLFAPALDRFAADRAKAFEQSAVGQSGEGQFGRIGGGLIGSLPMGAASLPQKGVGLLRGLGQGGAGGALAALTATPATSGDYWAEKAPQAAVGAGMGIGILAGLRGAAWTGEAITNMPRSAINFAQQRANRLPFAKEGEELAARTGIPLTPGMVSGGRAQTFAENMARQSIFTSDRAMQADIRIAEEARKYIDRIGRGIRSEAAGVDTVGTQVQGAVRGAVKRTFDAREEMAEKQYGAIHEALGGRPIVSYDRTRSVLESIANPGGTLSGDALKAAQQARRLLAQVGDGKPRTLRQAIQDRSFWGRGARGSENVFADLSPNAQRKFSAQLFGAIKDDIAAAASRIDGATTAGPGLVPYSPNAAQLPPGVGLGDALRRADENYRLYSEAISALEASPMARLLGDDISVGDFLQFNSVPAEKVVEKLGAMTPSEMRMTRDFMQQNAPDTWAAYKRMLLDDAANAATFLPTSAGGRQIPLNAAQFVRAIGGNDPRKYARLQAVFEPDEMAQIDDALNAMRRMGDKFGFNFSGTDVRAEARSLLDTLKSGSATGVASTVGQMSGLRAVTNVMLQADGRRAVIELSKLPPNTRRYAALAGYVSAVAAGQQMAYPEEGTTQPGQ